MITLRSYLREHVALGYFPGILAVTIIVLHITTFTLSSHAEVSQSDASCVMGCYFLDPRPHRSIYNLESTESLEVSGVDILER